MSYFVSGLTFFLLGKHYTVYVPDFVRAFHGPFVVCHYIFYKDCSTVQYLLYYLVIYGIFSLIFEAHPLISQTVNGER